MSKKTAIILGATGLVGSQLLLQLLEDETYEKVIVFVRREVEPKHPKIETHLIDFDKPESWKAEVKGDVLFSSLGTTIGKAGSKEVQYKVDYTYQYQMAEIAAENGVPAYVLISSAGAETNSLFFYSRMKAELDEAVKKLPFQSIALIKPSVLDGDRQENRLGEKMGIVIGKLLAPVLPPLRKYRPIHARIVATAMLNAAQPSEGLKVYELEDIFELAGE